MTTAADKALAATNDRITRAHNACASLFAELLQDRDVVRAIMRGDHHDPGRDLGKRSCAAMVEWTAASRAALAAVRGDTEGAVLCGRIVGRAVCALTAGHSVECRP